MPKDQLRLLIAYTSGSKNETADLLAFLGSRFENVDTVALGDEGQVASQPFLFQGMAGITGLCIIDLSEANTDAGFVIAQALAEGVRVLATYKKGALVDPIILGITDRNFAMLEYINSQGIVDYLIKLFSNQDLLSN